MCSAEHERLRALEIEDPDSSRIGQAEYGAPKYRIGGVCKEGSWGTGNVSELETARPKIRSVEPQPGVHFTIHP